MRRSIDIEDLLALLPGIYYMDPPDGGSVTVLEQLQRMAKDAERYRFLQMDAGTDNERPFIAIRSAGGVSQWTGIHADMQIDAVLFQKDKS